MNPKGCWERLKEVSIGLAAVCLLLALLVILASDKDALRKKEQERAEEEAVQVTKYKAVKAYGRTYNFFVVEIDGEEYVVGSDGTSITMVKKATRDAKRQGPCSGDRNVLQEGR
jgi:hypothetical protein